MGTKVSGASTTTTQATPSAAESEMQKAQLEQYKNYEPKQTQMYNNAFDLGNKLLTSFGNSDQWNTLIGGINNNQTNAMVSSQDRTLKGQLQQSGIYDSGTAASGRLRAGADIRNQNAQFNIGAMQNALNLALSGQAQVQSPANSSQGTLANQLAGLRTVSGQTNNSQALPYQGTNLGILGTWGGSYCWVSSEIFGGWYAPKTCAVRYFIGNIAPKWFKDAYIKYGKQIAKFIHNKPILKMALRPLFEIFAFYGKR